MDRHYPSYPEEKLHITYQDAPYYMAESAYVSRILSPAATPAQTPNLKTNLNLSPVRKVNDASDDSLADFKQKIQNRIWPSSHCYKL